MIVMSRFHVNRPILWVRTKQRQNNKCQRRIQQWICNIGSGFCHMPFALGHRDKQNEKWRNSCEYTLSENRINSPKMWYLRVYVCVWAIPSNVYRLLVHKPHIIQFTSISSNDWSICVVCYLTETWWLILQLARTEKLHLQIIKP